MKKKMGVSFYRKQVDGLVSDYHGRLGHDDAAEVEREDEFDDANYLFINF